MTKTYEVSQDGALVLSNPVELPEVLDVLIVGGGPAGAGAAFRAKEIGLSALVIDYDDILKRIRDYPKDKLILPGFGGGDKMKFPKGDELTELLQFGAIDKDDMCLEWKSLFVEHSIPTHVGVELTGLELGDDGIWSAKTLFQSSEGERVYRTRHVILAIGCGEPRRFDIPGNTDGVAYRLTEADMYIGKPVCVVGGGTSAAEAVISISNAKAKSEDSTGVYWSCRGEKMPRVSQALATVFFEAQMGNGNIRICPNSEVSAVVTAQNHKEYLSIRSDRRFIDGRPNETSHLEFEKEFCIACIGEDLPERLLNTLGIQMVTGGRNNKKRMALTPLMETQQHNVYMIGDLLRPAYLETDDFSADPETFLDVKHRGNIKAALRGGVKVVDSIKQRLDGKTDISVTVADAQEPVVDLDQTVQGLVAPAEAQAPPIQSEAPERVALESSGYLIRVLPGDVLEDEFPIKSAGVTTIGRKNCDITFPEDTMLSESHASLSHNEEGYFIRDDGSSSGVYLKATEGVPLEVAPGSMARAGRQFLQFCKMNGGYGFIHLDQTGKQCGRHEIGEKTLVLGRDAPDITLDANDKTLSRRHVAVSVKENRIFLKDLKSVNGTYLIVKDARKIEDGQRFRVGKQVFQLSLKEAPPSEAPVEVKDTPQPAPAAAPAGAPGALEITFTNLGKTVSYTPGQSICEIAEQNGISIVAECHAGICGSDPIKIISGKDQLNELSDGEKDALEDICELDPNECRLACMAKPTGAGPIQVEIIEQ